MFGEEGSRKEEEKEKAQDKAQVKTKRGKSDQAEAYVRSEDSERGLYDIEQRLCHRDLNPDEVSYGLLPNIWMSNMLEKHNQVEICCNFKHKDKEKSYYDGW